MATREDQPELIVGDLLRRLLVGRGRLRELGVPADRVFFGLRALAIAQVGQRSVARCRHQPRAGILRDASEWPSFERGDEGVLRELLRAMHVAEDARERRDDLRA